MSTTGTTVSTAAVWDQKIGRYITTTTLKSFSAWPTLPGGAINPQKSYQDGEYTVVYQDYTDSGGGPGPTTSATFSYEIHATTSSEPLKSFWKFANTALGSTFAGTFPLNATDLVNIGKIESGESGSDDGKKGWGAYLVGGTGYSSASNGMKAYAFLASRGQDSYLQHSLTLSITDEETSLPSMSEVGKVSSVSGPTLPSGGNWLLTGMSAAALANGNWKVSREYRGSGYGGWNPFLYT